MSLCFFKRCFIISLPDHNSGEEARRSFFSVFKSNAVGFFSGLHRSGEPWVERFLQDTF